MSKHRIIDVYDNENTLFKDNAKITADERLDFLTTDILTDLDTVIQSTFPSRELMSRYLDDDHDYVISRLQTGVYAHILAWKEKYKRLLRADSLIYDPLDEYSESIIYGAKHSDFKHAERNTENHTAARQQTQTDYSTSVDDPTERETGKSVTQDNLPTGSTDFKDSFKADQYTDETDTRTYTDTKSGYKSAVNVIRNERSLADFSSYATICEEVANYISYAILL